MKSVITDEFESLKKSFLKEVIIFKNELLQSIIAKTPENHSLRLIGHLESQIFFLQRELKEKHQLVNSLLDQISKCNDIIKSNQELSKNNKKLLENKILIKQDRSTTTTNKESKKSGKKNELNETPSEEKSEKCISQQNTSISGSNNNKSDKTKNDKSLTNDINKRSS